MISMMNMLLNFVFHNIHDDHAVILWYPRCIIHEYLCGYWLCLSSDIHDDHAVILWYPRCFIHEYLCGYWFCLSILISDTEYSIPLLLHFQVYIKQRRKRERYCKVGNNMIVAFKFVITFHKTSLAVILDNQINQSVRGTVVSQSSGMQVKIAT